MKNKLPLFLSALALSFVLVAGLGCGRKQSGDIQTYGSKNSRDEHGHAAHGHGHVHKAPNGGELVELGDHQFNIEFLYDKQRGVLRAWFLDAHAENFIRVAMDWFEVHEEGGQGRKIELRSMANNLTGEAVGDTSYFEGEAPWLGGIKHFDGVIKALRVRGTDFRNVRIHLHP